MKRTAHRWETFKEWDAIRLHMNMTVTEFCAFLDTGLDTHWRAQVKGYVSKRFWDLALELKRTNKPREGPPPPSLTGKARSIKQHRKAIAQMDSTLDVVLDEMDLEL